MSWTMPRDVINSWVGANVPTDEDKLQVWIDRAERLIRKRVPDLQVRLDVEAEIAPPEPDLLNTTKDVVVGMVTEVFKNPDGMRSLQTTTGPFTNSTTFGGDNPGKLTLSTADENMLSGVRPGEAFTVDMIAGP